ncbi:histidine phosphatase family protein [Luminiphilus sp.]|jgi:broad specificity phosphatase PhoE|nr:histidine phosphatase family protein [Luminiphilus sp.]MDA9836561.1 histidine phosphatase family protein [Luminiphilus sp.]MDA9915544.1 histidine phosphatase family protein [Luminiphilus sp.]MDB2557822.1 histidine phosphatase family protein [Luminiphilus sp.]
MADLLIIRHGQASFGADNYDQLSTLGQRQADLTGEFLSQSGVHFSAAFSGDLSRQRETGERILAQLEDAPSLVIDPRLNEVQTDEQMAVMTPLLCEQDPRFATLIADMNKDSKSFQKIIETVFNYWVSPNCQVAGIQSWQDYSAGVVSAFEAARASAESGSTSAIFTSGGTIATLVGHVLGLSADRVYEFYEPVFNCSITRLIFNSRKCSLSTFNDVSHLQLMGAQRGERLVTYR